MEFVFFSIDVWLGLWLILKFFTFEPIDKNSPTGLFYLRWERGNFLESSTLVVAFISLYIRGKWLWQSHKEDK